MWSYPFQALLLVLLRPSNLIFSLPFCLNQNHHLFGALSLLFYLQFISFWPPIVPSYAFLAHLRPSSVFLFSFTLITITSSAFIKEAFFSRLQLFVVFLLLQPSCLQPTQLPFIFLVETLRCRVSFCTEWFTQVRHRRNTSLLCQQLLKQSVSMVTIRFY